jgi:hypothetical protein
MEPNPEGKITALKLVNIILFGETCNLKPDMIVNEAMQKRYGWPAVYVGKTLESRLSDCTSSMLYNILQFHVPSLKR